MNLQKLIYDVRDSVRQVTDYSFLDDRYIIYLYNILRARNLRRDLNDFQKTVDNSILQKFCLELEEVSINECNIEYDCGTILRSKQKIPTPLELSLKTAITSVKPSNRTAIPFNFVNKERAIWSKYSSFGNAVYAFLDSDEYIYLVSTSDAVKLIDCITVEGVFEDPLELKNYKNCCGCEIPSSCYDETTTEYPLQPHHIASIRLEIVKMLIGTLQLPKDENNNADES